MIRSDNGTEFKNYTLDEFLGDEGIKHQYSAPYTPQQNGVAERKNRTLIDAARTMMAEFKSPYNFWAEAINTACHASNRLYLRKGLNKTPYEILTGNKPNLKYFRVFGCKCFILKKGARLAKFDSRAHEGIFVGYATNSHAYRVLNKSTGLTEETCNMRASLLVMLQTLMLTVSSISPRDLLRRRVTWSLMRITAPKWSKVVLVM